MTEGSGHQRSLPCLELSIWALIGAGLVLAAVATLFLEAQKIFVFSGGVSRQAEYEAWAASQPNPWDLASVPWVQASALALVCFTVAFCWRLWWAGRSPSTSQDAKEPL